MSALFFIDGFNPIDACQRELLLYLMMTSCDLSDQVKPFDSASKAAVCLPTYGHRRFMNISITTLCLHMATRSETIFSLTLLKTIIVLNVATCYTTY